MSKKHNKYVILPYNMLSAGASALATQLNCLRVRENGMFMPRQGHTIINWGNPRKPVWGKYVTGPEAIRFLRLKGRVLNHWTAVEQAIDKYQTLITLSKNGVPTPTFTCNSNVAASWFSDKNTKVVCRTLLRASEGKGIVIAKEAKEIVNARLYTKFFVKDKEYRVHVFGNEVLDIQEKRLKNGEREKEGHNPYIRNTANGWVFCRENVECPEHVQKVAVDAVAALGLDFGAVDIAINAKGEPCVFEVNTAPGIEGTTVNKYVEAIQKL